ncbi:MAG: DNA-processing protein DprA [Candidatus Falkowbacteria bacterium]
MSERQYLLCLSAYLGFGPVSLRALYNRLGSWQAVFTATATAIESSGLSPLVAAKFLAWQNGFRPEQFLGKLASEKIQTIIIGEADYPELLLQIHQPPFVLFYQGNIGILNNHLSLAVVGSRAPSSYGQQLAKMLIPPVAAAGVVITSGLAIGIDSLAHRAALEAGGLTAAIIGSGLDKASLYPASNQALAAKIIASGGVVISEFPPGTPGFQSNFPRRNRLIAGVSEATLVLEAAAKSGSLITARYALEQNREVMTVPGPIGQQLSAGPNELIKQGAKVITTADDILSFFGVSQVKSPAPQDLNEDEAVVYQSLANGPKTADELKLLLNLDICVITTTLSLLELKGVASHLGGGQYGKI